MATATVDYQRVQEYIANFVESILPGGGNKEMYEKLFSSMNDKDFKSYMDKVAERGYLDIIVPNLTEHKLSTERNISIARKLGHEFFERVWRKETDPDKPSHLSNVKYMIIKLPVRRQSQHSIKGISTAEDNKRLDQLSGQPTGDSKAAKISYPEAQLLNGMNFPVSLVELLKVRGGDIGMFNGMKSMASKTGVISMASIADRATGVESTKSLHTFLTCAHLRNTL
jgi:hypothetical protein